MTISIHLFIKLLCVQWPCLLLILLMVVLLAALHVLWWVHFSSTLLFSCIFLTSACYLSWSELFLVISHAQFPAFFKRIYVAFVMQLLLLKSLSFFLLLFHDFLLLQLILLLFIWNFLVNAAYSTIIRSLLILGIIILWSLLFILLLLLLIWISISITFILLLEPILVFLDNIEEVLWHEHFRAQFIH